MKRPLAFLALLLFTQACRSAPRSDHLTVFAAASLNAAFSQLADSFRVRNPGVTIDFNFAGSQILALQLTQGAEADVFASADENWMSAVRDGGLVQGEAAVFAHNRLVVIVPAGNPARIERLQDLGRRGVKLVLAGEQVPAGRYARQAITNLAQSDGFPPGYAAQVRANIVSNEENVKGVATKVQLAEADAGFVYSSDVTPEVSAKVLRIEIPDAQNVTAVYPIAVLKRAANPLLAREFVELLLSDLGQSVLKNSGFLSPNI